MTVATDGRPRQPAGTPVKYFGGKHHHARWVTSLLPYRAAYVEPCAGMLSVLVARQPSRSEVANDLNGLVVAFWRALRDHPDELLQQLTCTPYSRCEYRAASVVLANPQEHHPVEVARCLVVRLAQSGQPLADPDLNGWSWSRTIPQPPKTSNQRVKQPATWDALPAKLDAVARRIKQVEFEQRDALTVLTEWAPQPDTVIYLDPPYGGHDEYQHELDFAAASEVLAGAQAAVAISGYPGCGWDSLGWERHERFAYARTFTNPSERTECLWVNYDTSTCAAPQVQSTMSLFNEGTAAT